MSFIKTVTDFFNSLFAAPKEPAIEIYSPMDGEIVSQKSIPDETFSEGYVGEGLGILPSSPEVIAPVSGILEVLYPTKHAYVIREQKSGIAIFLHIGIDTVKIPQEENAFTTNLKQHDHVAAKSSLCMLNLEVINKLAPSAITPILIQKDASFDGKEIVYHITSGKIKKGDLLFSIVAK